jgi:hypothetical protein
MEMITKDKASFIASDSVQHFEKAAMQTNAAHRSGNYSVIMDGQKQYALDTRIKAKPGSIITVSVWEKTKDEVGYIVFSGLDGTQYYKSGAAIMETDENGWQKVSATCIVPNDYKKDSIAFYMYYPAQSPIYLDDLSMITYNVTSPLYAITCNMESRTDDGSSFKAICGDATLEKGRLQNSIEYHSGTHSINLDTKDQFGLDNTLNIKPGDSVVAEIWRKSTDGMGALVFSAPDPKVFYRGGQTTVKKGQNGWEQIRCSTIVPSDYKDNTLNFYVYYNGSSEAWFDDLCIRVYRR